MHENKLLLNFMIQAVRNHDINAFRHALQSGFEVRIYLFSSDDRAWIPFVELVARSGFASALRVLLTEMNPRRITQSDAVQAFRGCIQSGAHRNVIAIFLDASLDSDIPFLRLGECFRYAIEYYCSRIALRVLATPGFDKNGLIWTVLASWERPVHLAVQMNDYDVLRHLLQGGAWADPLNSVGTTPLVIACNNLNLDNVKLLLKYGANPNFKNEGRKYVWPFGQLMNQQVPAYPIFKSNLRKSGSTYHADKIVESLVCAGFNPTADHWIQHTKVMLQISRSCGETMRKLVYQMPTMLEVANNQGRQAVRLLMKINNGGKFNDFVSGLQIPQRMKNQLKINL